MIAGHATVVALCAFGEIFMIPQAICALWQEEATITIWIEFQLQNVLTTSVTFHLVPICMAM